MSPAGDVRDRAWPLLDAVLDLPPAERAAFLDRACGDDAELRDAVERLLAADAAASPLLDGPALALAAGMVQLVEQAPKAVGRVVGPYRIVRELGRGGMGVVYLAERTDVPLRVALKLVRGELAAPEHTARFAVEQRVLARLAHPHIARLLDTGVADDGTPYVAMEYVDGVPIDVHCDARRLTVVERLALFEQVCQAAQYAHEHLVVHRDLKPSNILVGVAGEVKLLDFGIAKLLGGDDTGGGLTQTGVRLLTPDYAAPEQLRGEPVTTATDVYALGGVLYELLTGHRPHAGRRDRAEDDGRYMPAADITRPSAIVSRSTHTSGGVPEKVSTARHTTPGRLARQLRGDLDTVVLKTLAVEPERRYPSAQQLLDDLHRFRAGRPVLARPDTFGYRTGKFLRRHRIAVTAAVLTVLVLAGFGGVMAYQQAQTAAALRRVAAEAEKARQVTAFVIGTFRDVDPFQQSAPAGESTAVREVLRLDPARIERDLAGQPEVRVELLHALGVIRRNLGQYDQAERLLRQGVDEQRRAQRGPGRADAEFAELLHDLGTTLRLRNDYTGAEVVLEQALTIRRTMLPQSKFEVAATLYELGTVRRYQARLDDAERLLDQALAIQRQRPESAELADALGQLAIVRKLSGDFGSAEQLLRQALGIRERTLGGEHPDVGSTLARLADVQRENGELDAAERTARRALAIQRRRLDPSHPAVLVTEADLSIILAQKGELDAAERLQRGVLERRRRTLGERHRDVAGSLHNLARIRRQRGDLVGAEALLRRSVAIFEQVSGPSHPDVSPVLLDLAMVRYERGDRDDAVRLALRVIETDKTPTWDVESGHDLAVLATALHRRGDCERAEPLYQRAASVFAIVYPQNHPARMHVDSGVVACRTTPGR